MNKIRNISDLDAERKAHKSRKEELEKAIGNEVEGLKQSLRPATLTCDFITNFFRSKPANDNFAGSTAQSIFSFIRKFLKSFSTN